MKTTPFELTTEQKDLLRSLSQETGKPISALIAEALALIAEALEGLQAQIRLPSVNGQSNGSPAEDMQDTTVQSDTKAHKPIWEVFAATDDIPDEEWDKLTTDLATQHDHYIYGTPKRQI